jgi:tetratricopeptide (TPR) repeat protein
MLYSTIPPILIVLSLAGIIVFFMKKSSQIANLSDEDDLEKEKKSMMAKTTFWGKIKFALKNINWGSMKSIFLAFSEKLTRRAGIILMRLENRSKTLNDSIRNKKNIYKNRKNHEEKAHSAQEAEDQIIEKVSNYGVKKKSYLTEMKNVLKGEKKYGGKSYDSEERIIKPMVSDKVVTPSGRAEMKDRLENLLIERIAANPKDVEAYERLGEYYMEIDSLGDAKECFKQVLKLDPKNRNVKYTLLFSLLSFLK